MDLPTSSVRVATGATNATIVATPPEPDGAETMIAGLETVTLPDFGSTVVATPTVVVVTSGTTVLVVSDCTTVVVGDKVVEVVVVVVEVVVVVAAAAAKELSDCAYPIRSVMTRTPTVSPGSTPDTVTTSFVRLIEPRLTERKYV